MDQFDEFKGFDDRPATCAVCEAMLPDAVDHQLSEAEQRAFDKHLAGCTECSRELAEAQRGAAWLSLLKTQAPEPPSDLLAKILAETSGAPQVMKSPAAFHVPVQETIAPARLIASPSRWNVRLAMLRQQISDVFSVETARATFQPRMAMTAAMAFFSIALTLNLTGVRLRDLRASNFTPSAIKRTVADLDASATRMFQNNRAIYQVESRLSELRSDDAGADTAPAGHR